MGKEGIAMDLSFFRKRPIKLVSASLLVIIIILLAFNAFNIGPFDEQAVIQAYRPNKVLEEAGANLSTYDMQIEFNPDTNKIKCVQNFEYINNTTETHDRLYFHIYPNAFKYETKVPFPQEEMIQAYPNGFSPGGIELISVSSTVQSLHTL